MQNIRSKDTLPEKLIMTALRRERIYFGAYAKKLCGKPDIVFRRKKIAIFVDSDFWHGHEGHFTMPKTNVAYWSNKIKQNKRRDKAVNLSLKKSGWRVIRVWEYDIKKQRNKVLCRIKRAIHRKD